MAKQIKIMQSRDKQIGVRVPEEVYDKIVRLSKLNKTSVQKVASYILTEEINSYLPTNKSEDEK